MTNEEIATYVFQGFVELGIEGAYNNVCCSTAGDYPSVGIESWEGDRYETLLTYIDGGSTFSGRTYSDLENTINDAGVSDRDSLAALLDSEQGHAAQDQIATSDCQEYVEFLQEKIPEITNDTCLIYAALWCSTSLSSVVAFIRNRLSKIDVNDLDSIYSIFSNEYAAAVDCAEYQYGYSYRAANTYNYVTGLKI